MGKRFWTDVLRSLDLTVAIRGICREHVVVERDGVILRGRDPALGEG